MSLLYNKGIQGATMIKCRLKILLAEHDMTQKELAEKTGIREASIGDMCNNKAKHIPVDTIDKLCEFFDCQVSDLFIRI